MYLIKNEDQKRKTIKLIEEFKKKLSRIRQREGTEAAKLFSEAYRARVEELRRQVRVFETIRGHGLAPSEFSKPDEFGQYLVKARIASRKTQGQLARELQVSQPMIYKYEAAQYMNAGLDVLLRVAEILGVSVTITAALARGSLSKSL